jgi:hypothetical protein
MCKREVCFGRLADLIKKSKEGEQWLKVE